MRPRADDDAAAADDDDDDDDDDDGCGDDDEFIIVLLIIIIIIVIISSISIIIIVIIRARRHVRTSHGDDDDDDGGKETNRGRWAYCASPRSFSCHSTQTTRTTRSRSALRGSPKKRHMAGCGTHQDGYTWRSSSVAMRRKMRRVVLAHDADCWKTFDRKIDVATPAVLIAVIARSKTNGCDTRP